MHVDSSMQNFLCNQPQWGVNSEFHFQNTVNVVVIEDVNSVDKNGFNRSEKLLSKLGLPACECRLK